jgi:hypothetical protein
LKKWRGFPLEMIQPGTLDVSRFSLTIKEISGFPA